MALPQSRYRPPLRRSQWLLSLLLSAFALVLLRVTYIQVVRRAYYLNNIGPQIERGHRTLVPQPGWILASNGDPLAESVLLDNLVADPARMAEHGESYRGVADEVAPLINRPYNDVLADLQNHRTGHYVELQRWVTDATAKKIKTLSITGLALRPTWQRQYPQGSMACQTLGARDKFGRPLFGLEYQYRLLLDGQRTVTPDVDTFDQGAQGGRLEANTVPGKDLVLTINLDLQRQVEIEMDRMWKLQTPKWADCVVIDPRTGDILAIADRPNFDPNAYVTGKPAPGCKWSPVPRGVNHNIPVEYSVEPGSTFKPLLVAAALDKGVITPASTFYCGGHLDVDGQMISCWGRYAYIGHGTLDVGGMMAESCNICAAQIALRLGRKAYHDFLWKAGLGQDPQAGFPAETGGILPPTDKIRPGDLANMGFGQNVGCSALQLTSIIAGIVNNGVMMHPHIIKEVRNKDGSVFRRVEPTVQTRLCSERTSAEVRKMLLEVVERGTGKTARIPGY